MAISQNDLLKIKLNATLGRQGLKDHATAGTLQKGLHVAEGRLYLSEDPNSYYPLGEIEQVLEFPAFATANPEKFYFKTPTKVLGWSDGTQWFYINNGFVAVSYNDTTGEVTFTRQDGTTAKITIPKANVGTSLRDGELVTADLSGAIKRSGAWLTTGIDINGITDDEVPTEKAVVDWVTNYVTQVMQGDNNRGLFVIGNPDTDITTAVPLPAKGDVWTVVADNTDPNNPVTSGMFAGETINAGDKIRYKIDNPADPPVLGVDYDIIPFVGVTLTDSFNISNSSIGASSVLTHTLYTMLTALTQSTGGRLNPIGNINLLTTNTPDAGQLGASTNIALTPVKKGDFYRVPASGIAANVNGVATPFSNPRAPIKGDWIVAVSDAATPTTTDFVVWSNIETTIIDALDSTSKNEALSANQGRILAEQVAVIEGDITNIQNDIADILEQTGGRLSPVAIDNVYGNNALYPITAANGQSYFTTDVSLIPVVQGDFYRVAATGTGIMDESGTNVTGLFEGNWLIAINDADTPTAADFIRWNIGPNVVNNLTATIAGSALDAVQGKALYDMIPKWDVE
jgi:hypothetical protein